MIATGNHNFERFAALCNTPGGSQAVQTFSLYALVVAPPGFGIEWFDKRYQLPTWVVGADRIRPWHKAPRRGCFVPGRHTRRPLQSVCEPVSGQYRTGRVREPMYWYKPCALLSGGTAARADSIRPYRACPFYGAHCHPQPAVGKCSNHEILAF